MPCKWAAVYLEGSFGALKDAVAWHNGLNRILVISARSGGVSPYGVPIKLYFLRT
jgi:hypothetical protein